MKPILFHILVLLFLTGTNKFKNSCASQSIVETLPGYAGPLPFKLETGYIGVGENEEAQMFYYFVQSENDPKRDPLLLWLTGGPGCSSLTGLLYENGPVAFDLENFDGSLPSLILNPYSWTKLANIIFLDSPVGTGFSYLNTSSKDYASSDTKATQHVYAFLRKWLLSHPEFIKNRLFIAGDSYGGKIAPMVALQIANGNEAGLKPRMSLEGYIVGNPVTDEERAVNEMIPYAHRMALISDQQYELARSDCHEEYVNVDPNNIRCLYALHIFQENRIDAISYIWANDESVRESLHIRKGTVTNWKMCSNGINSFERDVESVAEYHQLLSDKGFQGLIYSGDHDMLMPYMSTLKWIRKLNFSVDEEWRPWSVDGQVAGYVELYKNDKNHFGYITFATVKGAGHLAIEYKPIECFEMVERWISLYPL